MPTFPLVFNPGGIAVVGVGVPAEATVVGIEVTVTVRTGVGRKSLDCQRT